MDLPLSTLQTFAPCGCHKGKDQLQDMLDRHNRLCNELDDKLDASILGLKSNIKALRGNVPPPCWGEDDCSTMMLVHCPWSIDCGE